MIVFGRAGRKKSQEITSRYREEFLTPEKEYRL
jgi:hypothetical protein